MRTLTNVAVTSTAANIECNEMKCHSNLVEFLCGPAYGLSVEDRKRFIVTLKLRGKETGEVRGLQ